MSDGGVLLPFLAAILGGALRVGVPFLFVSLGECLTEKSGRINLGLEGVLVLSAMAAFGGFGAAGSLLQRRLGLPDASVLVLQGIAFVLILASEALRDVDWRAVWQRLKRPSGPSGAQVAIGEKLA